MPGYYPNREPYVTLECGCIETLWGAMWEIGERWAKGPLKGKRKYRQPCPRETHPNPHRNGQLVIREATHGDLAAWMGIPVTEQEAVRKPVYSGARQGTLF